MGSECILFSLGVGLIPFFYGIYVLIVGKAHLSIFSKEPLRGAIAREMGCLVVIASAAYYLIVFWAWSHYDR